MRQGLQSPLSGRVSSGFGGGKSRHKNKIIIGAALAGVVPFLVSTFAASVTVGSGALEFGQGSQQAIACDPNVFAAISEEWHSAPTTQDASAGFFRVRGVTVSNLDLTSCRGKKLRVRLISTVGAELPVGPIPEAHVLQISLPNVDAPVTTSDAGALSLAYLTGEGSGVSSPMAASVSLNISGTSIYDGSDLSVTNADVTFYLDSTATLVNLDGQTIGRTTVETVNNPKR
ncbi:unannotated protein [freshwater metagenome]|jgi:hypothetical protein|uniref:Unannotated protein n=1 Tax=freshwater metagenome TaxID=449393 RepID=A0A6J7PNC8_9ZZZZ|nr:hypothetical protein [Actinomycetota bacterium]